MVKLVDTLLLGGSATGISVRIRVAALLEKTKVLYHWACTDIRPGRVRWRGHAPTCASASVGLASGALLLA